MKPLSAIAAVCLTGFSAVAQQTGPALFIDANAGQHPISPDIYGISGYWNVLCPVGTAVPTAPGSAVPRPTVRRCGGDNATDYNWQLDVFNNDADWFYEVLPGTVANPSALPAGGSFNAFADQ